MPPMEECALGAANKANIGNLEKEIGDFRCEMRKALKEIRDKLIGRPPWPVVFILTGLCSTVVALLILVLK